MLISLNWIRDFVDLPADLDVHALAEKFTRTTAEVETAEHLNVAADKLICARVLEVEDLPGTPNMRLARLDLGDGTTIETVTIAPVLPVGWGVVYAPPGASVKSLGEIGKAQVAGRESVGMILPGDGIGVAMAVKEAIFLAPDVPPGQALPPEWFDDWLIEVDNKSITHRPDLWGHYGIAREIAAITKLPLKPYPVTPLEELLAPKGPAVEIDIADPSACPRFNGMFLRGVPTQPAPLWLQLRLGHVGMRPISGLVDLTNYIMADLGQPMHAYDADKVARIEVDWAADGETFRTLDGTERELTAQTLMIKCDGKNIGIAGVMGGLDTEVTDTTTALMLEAANFEPSTVRRTATRLGLRTDASARFEKSLDPANTALSIQRFIALAKSMYPNLELAGKFTDAHPAPKEPIVVTVNPEHVSRTVGRPISRDEAAGLLEPLGFAVYDQGAMWQVTVPSYRATNDISIEADVIEEVARCIGYDTIEPVMPRISVQRFAPHALHDLENASLRYLSTHAGFSEVHGYLWYDSTWIDQLGYNPGDCVALRNPAADGLHRLRHSLIPGMLGGAVKNRFHFPAFSMMEVGTTFECASPEDKQYRRLGLIVAQRGKKTEDAVLASLKGSIEAWSWQLLTRRARFAPVEAAGNCPWEQGPRTASIEIGGIDAGRVGAVELPLRQRMDEHLAVWGLAWAELRLDTLADQPPEIEALGRIPAHPRVELDFSLLVPEAARFSEVTAALDAFQHDLLREIRYVGSYAGKSVGAGKRSLTFKAVIGHGERTLVEDDSNAFQSAFEAHVGTAGYEIRRS